ncbi:hypothetical protein HAX54_026742 [Datura stramonium]|uniref:Secreted protein n=1 Tax=Datura stramonium TaxID=4076 RepID=A0ABS8S858_DATST|nr:hypothetical protein [Datura stramonium]
MLTFVICVHHGVGLLHLREVILVLTSVICVHHDVQSLYLQEVILVLTSVYLCASRNSITIYLREAEVARILDIDEEIRGFLNHIKCLA